MLFHPDRAESTSAGGCAASGAVVVSVIVVWLRSPACGGRAEQQGEQSVGWKQFKAVEADVTEVDLLVRGNLARPSR
jgi:hypothetical protein